MGYKVATNQQQRELNNTLRLATCKTPGAPGPPAKKNQLRIFAVSVKLQVFLVTIISQVVRKNPSTTEAAILRRCTVQGNGFLIRIYHLNLPHGI